MSQEKILRKPLVALTSRNIVFSYIWWLDFGNDTEMSVLSFSRRSEWGRELWIFLGFVGSWKKFIRSFEGVEKGFFHIP